MVQWLSLFVAIAALGLSWWWHRRDASNDADTRRIAVAAADAQSRLANAEPWSAQRNDTGVLVINRTGAVAAKVTMWLDGPWFFWDDEENDPHALRQQPEVEHQRIDAGSSVLHRISSNSQGQREDQLHVRWHDAAGMERTWAVPVRWILR